MSPKRLAVATEHSKWGLEPTLSSKNQCTFSALAGEKSEEQGLPMETSLPGPSFSPVCSLEELKVPLR